MEIKVADDYLTTVELDPTADSEIIQALGDMGIWRFTLGESATSGNSLTFYTPRLAEEFVDMTMKGPKHLKRKADYIRFMLRAEDVIDETRAVNWLEADSLRLLLAVFAGVIAAVGVLIYYLIRLIR